MGRAGSGDSHPIMKEWGGVCAVPSQVRDSIQATYMKPQTFPTSSLPQDYVDNSNIVRGLAFTLEKAEKSLEDFSQK
jgi:hypothetical protein